MEKKNYARIFVAMALLLIIIIAYALRLDKKISLTFLQDHHQLIQELITNHYILSVILYVIIYILFVITMLPITLLLNIASGYFFGVFPGTLYSVIGSVTGSLASFLIFRYILREWAIKRYHKKLLGVEQEFEKHGAGYILSLQLFPITPFALINIIAGLSNIPAWKYACITVIGVTPYTFLYAFAGRKLIELTSLKELVSPWFITLFAVLSFGALAPMLLQRLRTKFKKK